MCVPVIRFGQGLVDAVIEVFVVREDDMSSDIVELQISLGAALTDGTKEHTNPSGVTSVEASPPGVSLESTRSHEVSFYRSKQLSGWRF